MVGTLPVKAGFECRMAYVEPPAQRGARSRLDRFERFERGDRRHEVGFERTVMFIQAPDVDVVNVSYVFGPPKSFDVLVKLHNLRHGEHHQLDGFRMQRETLIDRKSIV